MLSTLVQFTVHNSNHEDAHRVVLRITRDLPTPISLNSTTSQLLKGIVLPNFATLCYLRYRSRVLLLRKAKGLFGEGKWNAPGGKLIGGETPEEGTLREMLEETGLKVSGLHFHGILNFYLGRSRRLDQVVFVFSCVRHTGKMRRSREGILRWFLIHQIPYSEMWEDDREWLPFLLEGENFVGDFHFTDNYGCLIGHKLHLTP